MTARLLVVLLAAVALDASQIEPLDLKALPGQSTLVVIGQVVSTRTTISSNGLYEKLSVVRITSVLQGKYAQKDVRVRTRSGLVFFDRHLEPGDSGVFFLKPSPYGDFGSAYPNSFALFQKQTVKPLQQVP